MGNAPETEPDQAPRGHARTGAEREAAIRRHEQAAEVAEPKVEEVRPDEPRIGLPATHEFHTPGCSRLAGVAPAEQIRFTSPWEAIDAHYSPCKECSPLK